MKLYHGFVDFIVKHSQANRPIADVTIYAKMEPLSVLKKKVYNMVFDRDCNDAFKKSFQILLERRSK